MTLKPYGRNENARAQADRIIELYQAGDGHKTIAKALGLSARIVRVVLMEQGKWKPGSLLRQGIRGQGKRDAFKRAHRHIRKSVDRTVRHWIRKRDELQRPQRRKVPLTKEERNAAWMHRYKNDMRFRFTHVLRKRVVKLIKRGDKAKATMDMLGCTIEEFKAHIERQFKPGMSWYNHGTGRGRWQVDHIIPCNSFDLTRQDHQARCFHYTNMQPMWAIANTRKRAHTPSQHQWRLL